MSLDVAALAGALPPSFIVLNLITIWSIHLSFRVKPAWDSANHAAIPEVIITQLLVLMFTINFFLCIKVHPGKLPDVPEWRIGGQADSANEIITRETKVSGERRTCKWCHTYKPDRCHHCRICQSCVLKMDHHCPWIMNCVGYRNHKFFFLLVNYAFIALVYIGILLFMSVRDSIHKEMLDSDRFILVLGMMMCIIMGILMGGFGAFHWFLVVQGISTIEYCEKVTDGSPNKSGKSNSSIYDLGAFQNLKAALGPNVLLWPFPVGRPNGDGVTWEVNEVHGSSTAVKDNDALIQRS